MTQPITRCPWPTPGDELYEHYHDTEWGVPVHDDRHLFEMLTLEGAQAGLSWDTWCSGSESATRRPLMTLTCAGSPP